MVGHEASGLPASLSDGLRLFDNTRYVPHFSVAKLSYIHNLIISTATSVDVERVFSKGRLVLSHVRNGLSVQSTRASICLGAWSKMGLVKDNDVMEVVKLPDVKGVEDKLNSDWDYVL
jgi:hypothetical protein